MIKKFKIELSILVILLINIFISNNVDIAFYNFFNNLSKPFHNIYLKYFFWQITHLGDFTWLFIPSLFVIIFYYFIKKTKHYNNQRNIIEICYNFSVYLSLSLLTTGLLTQIIKNLVGRPRPNYTSLANLRALLSDGFEFNFFSLNPEINSLVASSRFHSFPSGHTATIFAAALVAILFWPKLKYFFIILAGIVASSRIIMGAHFFTDIVGGIAVSYIGVKLTKLFLDKRFPIKINKKTNILFNKKFYFSLVVLIFLAIFLAVGSSIDIYLSGLFYFGNNQFLLQSYYYITVFVREIILPIIVIYIFILPIFSMFLPLNKLYFKYKFKFKDIVFLWLTGICNLGVVVNLLLKNLWGRARPGDILELDGKEDFTPWFQISDACTNNCSFVSGDASVGFAIIVLYFLSKKMLFFWLSLFFGFGIGLIRIMEGGHFVSDVVMAALVLYLVYYFQIKYYFNKYD